MRIGIVGGGIGGFSAALSLARSGHDISVFERAASLSEVLEFICHQIEDCAVGPQFAIMLVDD